MTMRGRVLMRAAPAMLALFLAACGAGDDADLPAPSYGAEVEANTELYLENMEVGSRELYSARFAVVEALGLKPGERIGDVGAGTGLYTLLFAPEVGGEGAVFAIDIEPRFLKLVNQRAADLDLNNVTAVLGRDNSITLPEDDLDVVFISDTYNYFTEPQKIMQTIHAALKPGGRLFVLDFDIVAGEARSDENDHVRVGKDALSSEIESVGFVFEEDLQVDGLSRTYMLRFRKPEA